MRRAGLISAAVLSVLIAAMLVASDVLHHRASTRRLGDADRTSGRTTSTAPATSTATLAIVVLGFRNRGSRANLVNRWRIRVAFRTIRELDVGVEPLLVLSGGPVAEPLAAEARRRGYRGRLVLEPDSRSTWENLENSIPLIEHADRIAFASSAIHAEKAREYLRRQRPELAARLVRADDHRPGDLLLLEPIMAFRGLRSLRRLDGT